MQQTIAVSAVALAIASGAAQAAFFRFSPDTNDNSWAFTGNGANVTAATGSTPVILHIDDNNGPAPELQVSVSFVAQYTLTFVGSVNLPGGGQSLSYAANGSFSFTDIASGVTLLTTNFSNALFTTRGGANNGPWATTASLQVDDGLGAAVSMVWGGANLPAYGLMNGALNGSPRGFAFEMTSLNSSGALPYAGQNPGVSINPTTRLPTAQWWSEATYSSTAAIPAPATLAAVGVGALAMGRRRRR
ncbi:MAG TPA: PEP-CTERM sorting domain-containing protein [Phycisphaerales bacterium]|nr:PEP-CTERM sorting domain-containing protein [Phycisphaerales bacterium]